MDKKQDLEETIEVLLDTINKYSSIDLPHKQKNYMMKIKHRFYRYQVEHRQLVGSYYLIDRAKK